MLRFAQHDIDEISRIATFAPRGEKTFFVIFGRFVVNSCEIGF
jgi:hypothetical protein